MRLQHTEIFYYIDRETGEKLGTKEIHLEFEDEYDPAVYYGIDITWAKEYGKNGWSGKVVDDDALDLGAIKRYADIENKWVNIGIRRGDVLVILSARGMESEELLIILKKNTHQNIICK